MGVNGTERWAAGTPFAAGAPERRAAGPSDAVGHPLAVGDTVATLVGGTRDRGVIRQLTAGRLVVVRDDGMVAILRTTSVVFVRGARRAIP